MPEVEAVDDVSIMPRPVLKEGFLQRRPSLTRILVPLQDKLKINHANETREEASVSIFDKTSS